MKFEGNTETSATVPSWDGHVLLIFFLAAVYPEDSPVLGHCKGEPVYSRTNVHTVSVGGEEGTG